MCGRTACTLRQRQLQAATGYKPSKAAGGGGGGGQYRRTRWVDPPGGRQYRPSANLGPTDTLPVLVAGSQAGCADDERVLMPMRWGLVPHFHRGELAQMTLSTFNARSEEFCEKPMFARPFQRGQRCALVCDGYYEWKRDGGARKPYFLYADKAADWAALSRRGDDDDADADWSEQAGWTGRRLTTLAGIFERWQPPEGGDPVYSFTVLTQPANEQLAWLHHRQPVFLESDAALGAWISDDEPAAARALITPAAALGWHVVAPDVNHAANKSATFAPVKSTKQAGFMTAWLNKAGNTPNGKRAGEPDATSETNDSNSDDQTPVKGNAVSNEASHDGLTAAAQDGKASPASGKRLADDGERDSKDVKRSKQ